MKFSIHLICTINFQRWNLQNPINTFYTFSKPKTINFPFVFFLFIISFHFLLLSTFQGVIKFNLYQCNGSNNMIKKIIEQFLSLQPLYCIILAFASVCGQSKNQRWKRADRNEFVSFFLFFVFCYGNLKFISNWYLLCLSCSIVNFSVLLLNTFEVVYLWRFRIKK